MKREFIIGLVILALVVIVGIFFILNNSSNSTENNPAAQGNGQGNLVINQSNETPQQNQQTTPQTYNIEISGFAFKQSQLTINVGDTVIWTNKDSASHTVTSDSGTELNSNYISRNQMYSHTFNQAGTFDYHCQPHPYMKAKIIVR